MARFSFICTTVLLLASWANQALTAEAVSPRVFLLDGKQLEETRERLRAGDDDLIPAAANLVQLADRALKAGPFSVINKNVLPPSGDKHDYMSLAPYWWPNPDTRDGLPYVRRDGERNPEIYEVRNRLDLGEMADAVEVLSLAYYFTGKEPYAERAALLVRTWYIDANTRMNPHLQYGQSIRGVNDGRGEGLIETRSFTRVIDSVGLLAGSPSWTDDDQQALVAWFKQFRTWMLDSEHGRDEAEADNNHGTFYDVQLASYSLFIGDDERAKEVLQTVGTRRIASQVEPDGSQPLELARTKAWSYSVGNLAGLMSLARLGEHVGVDLWKFETDDGRSIRKALDYLAPFGMGERRWPYQQINGFSADLFYPLVRIAASEYPDGPYREMASRLPIERGAAGRLWLSPVQPISDLHRR